MIDIGKQTINLNCPKCKSKVNINVKHVADQKLVKCICGQGI